MHRIVTLARPIWTSAALTAWYAQQLYQVLFEAAMDLEGAIGRAWIEQRPEIGLSQDAAVGNLDKTLNHWARKWTSRFNRMSAKIAAAFAARSQQATEYSMQQMLKDAGWTVQFRPTRNSMEAYRAVAAENVGLIKSIGEKYHADVREKVWSAVRGGFDLSRLSIELRKTYGVSVKRAALIARDQSAKAKAVIEATRRQELGITEAVWRHSHAGRVPRPTHVRMDGKRYEIAKGMWDSEENAWVHPGQLINCRCSSSALIPGIHT